MMSEVLELGSKVNIVEETTNLSFQELEAKYGLQMT